MNIYLIRHTSVDVPKGLCYGQSDVPLRPTFEIEAAVTKAKIESIHFDMAYTSPLSRCTRLAQYCGFGDAIRDPRILELNFGDWEMQYLINQRPESTVLVRRLLECKSNQWRIVCRSV